MEPSPSAKATAGPLSSPGRQPTHTSLGLFDLPREVRDLIYEYATETVFVVLPADPHSSPTFPSHPLPIAYVREAPLKAMTFGNHQLRREYLETVHKSMTLVVATPPRIFGRYPPPPLPDQLKRIVQNCACHIGLVCQFVESGRPQSVQSHDTVNTALKLASRSLDADLDGHFLPFLQSLPSLKTISLRVGLVCRADSESRIFEEYLASQPPSPIPANCDMILKRLVEGPPYDSTRKLLKDFRLAYCPRDIVYRSWYKRDQCPPDTIASWSRDSGWGERSV